VSWQALLDFDDREGADGVVEADYGLVYLAWHRERYGGDPPSAATDRDGFVLTIPPAMPAADRAAWWTPGLEAYVRANLMAFRSLCRRLHNADTAPPRILAAEADRRFRWHLAQCALVPLTDVHGPLSADTFAGVDVTVRAPDPTGWKEVEPTGGRCPVRGFALIAPGWCRAFGSLVVAELAPRCIRCGDLLARTPTGRRSTRQMCPRCAFATWERQLPVEVRRERWRIAKKRRGR
jgi:hypothetical protein